MHRTKIIPWAITLMMSGVVAAQSSTPSASQNVARQPASTAAADVSPQAGKGDSTIQTTVTVNYTYDSLGRLIQESYPANTATFNYDAAGNRTQATTR